MAPLPKVSGAHDRGRTGDLVLTKDTLCRLSYVGIIVVVGRGFEPRKAFADRFTVCSLWPLGYPTMSKPDLGSEPDPRWSSIIGQSRPNVKADSAVRTTIFASQRASGADDPIRTDDLGITSALLFQLSYVGPSRSCNGGPWRPDAGCRPSRRGPRAATLGRRPLQASAHLPLGSLQSVVDLLDAALQLDGNVTV